MNFVSNFEDIHYTVEEERIMNNISYNTLSIQEAYLLGVESVKIDTDADKLGMDIDKLSATYDEISKIKDEVKGPESSPGDIEKAQAKLQETIKHIGGVDAVYTNLSRESIYDNTKESKRIMGVTTEGILGSIWNGIKKSIQWVIDLISRFFKWIGGLLGIKSSGDAKVSHATVAMNNAEKNGEVTSEDAKDIKDGLKEAAEALGVTEEVAKEALDTAISEYCKGIDKLIGENDRALAKIQADKLKEQRNNIKKAGKEAKKRAKPKGKIDNITARQLVAAITGKTTNSGKLDLAYLGSVEQAISKNTLNINAIADKIKQIRYDNLDMDKIRNVYITNEPFGYGIENNKPVMYTMEIDNGKLKIVTEEIKYLINEFTEAYAHNGEDVINILEHEKTYKKLVKHIKSEEDKFNPMLSDLSKATSDGNEILKKIKEEDRQNFKTLITANLKLITGYVKTSKLLLDYYSKSIKTLDALSFWF